MKRNLKKIMRYSLQTAILMLLIANIVYAQIPQAINYQAVARDNNGAIFQNHTLGVQLSILNGVVPEYIERFTVTTNQFGLFTVAIGTGIVQSGTFVAITWGAGNKFLKTEMDANGGTIYTDMGTTQFVSVPYALYAASGTPGPQGQAGTNGTNGTTWYASNGAPSSATGVVNDLYLNTSNGDYYKKTGVTTWTLQGNLTGPQGVQGASGTNGTNGTNGINGATWYTGSGVPLSATGVVNDLYLNTTNGDYYKKTGSSIWTLQGNLTGPQGIQGSAGTNGTNGINGATWYTGSGVPSGATGVVNDLYLNTANGNYYKKTGASTWTLQGNLSGTSGGSANLSGTLNYVIKFTPNDSTGGNSQIFDNGVNVGINTSSPEGKVHVKGSADTTQLIIDGNITQSNSNPLIKLRKNNGSELMWINSDDTSNIFIGCRAGQVNNYSSLSSGAANIFLGYGVGSNNSTGSWNTSGGYKSFYSNTTGNSNVALGRMSLGNNTTGNDNTAIGDAALAYNISGNDNTAIGWGSLSGHRVGGGNVAIGSIPMEFDSSGYQNIAIGYFALGQNNNGFENIAIGHDALSNNISGHDNSALGSSSGPSSGALINTTSIGSLAQCLASNIVRIGTAVTSIGGPQNWSNTSDARIKTNIKENIPGLKFINLLRPVSFNKSIDKESEITGRKERIKLSPDNNYEKMIYTGFIAQEVEQAAKKIGYNFSGVDAPKSKNDLYALRYAEFVVPLVKAVQELDQENGKLKNEIKDLIQRIEALEKK